MTSSNNIDGRAVSAAYHAVKDHGYVSAVDVFKGMGILSSENYEAWRLGRIPYLEKVVQSNLSKISKAMKAVRVWAREQGLKQSETAYRKWGSGPKHDLRFSKSGNPQIEKAYRTHFVSPRLREQKVLQEEVAGANPQNGDTEGIPQEKVHQEP